MFSQYFLLDELQSIPLLFSFNDIRILFYLSHISGSTSSWNISIFRADVSSFRGDWHHIRKPSPSGRGQGEGGSGGSPETVACTPQELVHFSP